MLCKGGHCYSHTFSSLGQEKGWTKILPWIRTGDKRSPGQKSGAGKGNACFSLLETGVIITWTF